MDGEGFWGDDPGWCDQPVPVDPCPEAMRRPVDEPIDDLETIVLDPTDMAGLAGGELLEMIEKQRLLAGKFATDKLIAAARYAAIYETLPRVAQVEGHDPDRTRRVALAGEGAPLVHEHAPLEYAHALGAGADTGRMIMGHALELAHRLPLMWKRVVTGRVEAWRARQVATQTLSLSAEVAAAVDELLAKTNRVINKATAEDLVTEALLICDPDEAARREAAAQDTRGVFLDRDNTAGTTTLRDVFARLDAPDAEALDATLEKIARILTRLTPEGEEAATHQALRATALGILADPHTAAELLDTGMPPSTGTAVVYVHADAHDLADLLGDHREHSDHGARMERYGPATLGLVQQWLRRCDVKVTPVINMGTDEAVDAHDPPARMREQVILRDAVCQAPYCNRSARTGDLDHIEPFIAVDEGGPPGQTRPSNLQALCRRHHRMKTHAAHRYRALVDRSERLAS